MTLLPLSGSGPVFLDTITQRLKRAARYTRHRMSDNTRDTQNSFMTRLAAVRARIAAAERQYGRAPGSVALLAISKQQPVEVIAAAHAAGLSAFGENYLQEALPKIAAAQCLHPGERRRRDPEGGHRPRRDDGTRARRRGAAAPAAARAHVPAAGARRRCDAARLFSRAP